MTSRLTQSTEENRFINDRGTRGAIPKMRRSAATCTPTTNPMATEWRIRLEKNAGPDSRIQVLKEVASTHTRYSISCA